MAAAPGSFPVGATILYALVFFLGGGIYAGLLSIPIRAAGARNTGVFNLVVLSWVPVFALIVYLWHPTG